MKILFTRFPYTSADGGAENQTTWLLQGLRGRGHDVSFLGSCPVLLKRFRDEGAHTAELDIGKPPVTKWLALSFFWRRHAMKRKLIDAVSSMKEKPEAILMLSLSEKILLTEWAKKQGMKVLWVEHDRVGPWLSKNPWLASLVRQSSRVLTVCVSDLSAAIYRALGFDAHNILAIPNGVPDVAPLPRHTSGTPLHLGCVARLSPEKGIDVLLEAIADLPEVRLTIVGQGSEEGYLRSLIAADAERMGGARIDIRPTVENIAAFYTEIDALVLPSREHDPFGLVAAEAMVRGEPVLITSACGIADYLKDGEDAIVVAPDDAMDMKRGIRRLLAGAVRDHIAITGMARARALFSLTTMVDRYEAALQDEQR